jgi:predicted RNase H-like HicB family nuclease
LTIKAIIHQAEEGGFWAEVPGLPGCMTEGETLDQVKANIVEAVHGWIEAAEGLALEQIQARHEGGLVQAFELSL